MIIEKRFVLIMKVFYKPEYKGEQTSVKSLGVSPTGITWSGQIKLAEIGKFCSLWRGSIDKAKAGSLNLQNLFYKIYSLSLQNLWDCWKV